MTYPKHAKKYLTEHGLPVLPRKFPYFSAKDTRKLVGLPKDNLPSDGIGFKLRRKPKNGADQWSVRFLRTGAEPKFKQSFRSCNEFFLPDKWEWDRIKRDTSITVRYVEGWNKAHTAAEYDLETIGLNGVYGHRSKGKPLRDFTKTGWKWKGRVVRICFDSDVLYKPQVQQAVAQFYRYLVKLGALPEIVVIESTRGKKIGPDDFLQAKGAAAFEAIPGLKLGEGITREWAAPKIVRQLNQELAFTVYGSQAMVIRTAPDPDYPNQRKATFMRPARSGTGLRHATDYRHGRQGHGKAIACVPRMDHGQGPTRGRSANDGCVEALRIRPTV